MKQKLFDPDRGQSGQAGTAAFLLVVLRSVFRDIGLHLDSKMKTACG